MILRIAHACDVRWLCGEHQPHGYNMSKCARPRRMRMCERHRSSSSCGTYFEIATSEPHARSWSPTILIRRDFRLVHACRLHSRGRSYALHTCAIALAFLLADFGDTGLVN